MKSLANKIPAILRPAARFGRRMLLGEWPIVLMYHRVTNLDFDPWNLAVSPLNFAEQIKLLRRAREVIPLSELAAAMQAGQLPRRAAVITFDDAYADVFHEALPVLLQNSCPASVFVTTDAIGGGSFWWDVLARIVLRGTWPASEFCLDIDGRRIDFSAEPDSQANRYHLHGRLHSMLKPLQALRRAHALEQLAAHFQTDACGRELDRAMSIDELKLISQASGIEIGAHTMSHPSLPTQHDQEIKDEIEMSRLRCEQFIGQPVRGFAYPYGDHDSRSVDAVRSSPALQYACTTESNAVRLHNSVLEIPRITVGNWGATLFRHKVLSNG